MRREIIEHYDIEELNKNINELRDVLNEICVTTKYAEEADEAEETENINKRLLASQLLDQLIVKYMNKENG